MKRWSLAVIGLVVYVIGIIATAPATLLDASLQGIGQGKLRLVEARGTLWSGSGQIEIRDSGGRAGVAKSVAWRILPESVLRGQLVCEVKLGQAKPFPVTLSLSRIELEKADVSIPATALGLSLPKLAPLGLTGELLLHVAYLSIERKQIHGNLTLQWREAGSALTPVSPLGDYELSFEGAGATVHALLRTLQGPLQLDGKGAWVNGGNLDFLATASVPPQHQQQLGPLLRLIAVERSAGSFELQLR
jgi:general secretion pathway protein N